MAEPPIDDDELLLKRVPPGPRWLKAGSGLTNANFELRHRIGETAVSVSRRRITTPARLLQLIPDEVLERLGSRPAWRVAEARAGDIRSLGFEIVADPTPDDPGHALIHAGERD